MKREQQSKCEEEEREEDKAIQENEEDISSEAV